MCHCVTVFLGCNFRSSIGCQLSQPMCEWQKRALNVSQWMISVLHVYKSAVVGSENPTWKQILKGFSHSRAMKSLNPRGLVKTTSTAFQILCVTYGKLYTFCSAPPSWAVFKCRWNAALCCSDLMWCRVTACCTLVILFQLIFIWSAGQQDSQFSSD